MDYKEKIIQFPGLEELAGDHNSHYSRTTPRIYNYDNLDPVPDFHVEPVSEASLPSGNGWRALGVYNLISRSAFADRNLHPANYTFTATHEAIHAKNHRRGITDTEIGVDMEAIARGAAPFIRSPEEYRRAG